MLGLSWGDFHRDVQRQLAGVGIRHSGGWRTGQNIVGAAARVLLKQQVPVTQTAQHAAGGQGVEATHVAAGGVVHRTGLAGVDQYLGLVGRQGLGAQAFKPAVVVFSQQVMQEQVGLELIALPIRFLFTVSRSSARTH